jgi:hypothetical protein
MRTINYIYILLIILFFGTSISATDEESIETYLPDATTIQGYTWNEDKVSNEISLAILNALRKYSSSFKYREKDVRIPLQGPMMELLPSSFWEFKHKNIVVSLELFNFSGSNRVVQVVVELEKKHYFSSQKIELILVIDKFKEIKSLTTQ